MFGLRVRGVLTRCTIGGVDGDGGAMGAALAAACARVEQPAATGDQTEGLQAFDRALLAQAGMSVQSHSLQALRYRHWHTPVYCRQLLACDWLFVHRVINCQELQCDLAPPGCKQPECGDRAISGMRCARSLTHMHGQVKKGKLEDIGWCLV